jgi:uncharacterized protein involved in exopolysaccharide biosynthesis
VTLISTDRSSTEVDDEFDLTALGRLCWGNKLLIGFVAIVCAGVAAAIAFTTEPVFRAEATITAVHERDLSNGGLASQLGALTSLVGVNLGQASSNVQTFDAVLESRRLVEEFIRRNDLLPMLSVNAKKAPTLWLAVRDFKQGVLTVRKDARKGVTTVAVEWTDPAIAARWANGLIRLANELIRARAIEDATRDIAYLNRQLEQTNALELRQALYDIIKNETKTLMLANGREEYAFETVDPAVPPERKVRPHRALNTLVGLALGLFLGTVIAFIRALIRRHRSVATPRAGSP